MIFFKIYFFWHFIYINSSEIVSREDDQSSYALDDKKKEEEKMGWCHDIIHDDLDLLNLS